MKFVSIFLIFLTAMASLTFAADIPTVPDPCCVEAPGIPCPAGVPKCHSSLVFALGARVYAADVEDINYECKTVEVEVCKVDGDVDKSVDKGLCPFCGYDEDGCGCMDPGNWD